MHEPKTGDAEMDRVLSVAGRVAAAPPFFIRSASRNPTFVHARAVAALVLREMGYGWKRIGRALNRSHSSVIGLVRDHEADDRVRRDVREVSETLGLKIEVSDTREGETTKEAP